MSSAHQNLCQIKPKGCIFQGVRRRSAGNCAQICGRGIDARLSYRPKKKLYNYVRNDAPFGGADLRRSSSTRAIEPPNILSVICQNFSACFSRDSPNSPRSDATFPEFAAFDRIARSRRPPPERRFAAAIGEQTIGIARAKVKIGLANLAYNMRRFLFLTTKFAAA